MSDQSAVSNILYCCYVNEAKYLGSYHPSPFDVASNSSVVNYYVLKFLLIHVDVKFITQHIVESIVSNQFHKKHCYRHQMFCVAVGLPTTFQTHRWYGMVWYGMVWYGMVWCLFIQHHCTFYISHHYITQDAEREMHEVQYSYVAFPCTFSIGKNWVKSCYNTIIITKTII